MTEIDQPVNEGSISQTEEKSPGVWYLLVDVIARPVPAFEAIARWQGVKWLLPALLVILTTVITLAVSAPYMVEEAKRQFQMQLLSMPPEQAEMVKAQAEQFMSPRFIMITGSLSAVVIQGLMWLLMAGALYFLALLAGGDVTFGAAWAMTPWLTLPFAVRNVVTAVWIYTQQSMITYSGLGALVATGDLAVDSRNPWVALLSQVDPFGLWHALLVYAAFRGGFNMSRRASLVLAGVYVVLMLGISTVPVFLGRIFG